MPFTIDKDTLLIKGREGDTAEMTFDFNKDISDYTVVFSIFKNIGDATAVVTKTFANPTTEYVTVKLHVADTELLESDGESPGIYYWQLKISKPAEVEDGDDFAQIIIPQEFKPHPQVHVYPEGYGG